MKIHGFMVSLGAVLGACGGGDDEPTCISPQNAVINGTCYVATVINHSQGVDTMGNPDETFSIGLEVENFVIQMSSYDGQVSSFPEFTPRKYSYPGHVIVGGGTIGSLSFLDVEITELDRTAKTISATVSFDYQGIDTPDITLSVRGHFDAVPYP